jgi:hypothetical protein
MKRIFTPSVGTSSWRVLLADPDLHWKRGASAMELAVSWELAASTDRGLPTEVAQALDLHGATRGAELVFGVPEHRVALPGGRRASQTDLWAVVRANEQLVSVAVEGKAGEPFGPRIDEWLEDASPGKHLRLEALCKALGVVGEPVQSLRYQLFHRAASSVLEAARIGAKTAVFLVQNFRPDTVAWADFEAFVTQFGVSPCRGGVCESTRSCSVLLLFAWVDSPLATDAQLAMAV